MNNEFFRRYIDIITEAAVPPAAAPAAPGPAPAKPAATPQQAASQYKGQGVEGAINISALKALLPGVDGSKLSAAMTAVRAGKVTPAHYQIMGIAFQQLVKADAVTTTKIMNILKKVSAAPATPVTAPTSSAAPTAATTMI
jgi:hypothetical protein